MVDRIDKLKTSESWKIQEANPSKKDKRNQSDEEKQQNARSSFEDERPDWDRLIAKENSGSGNLFTRDLKKISFKQTGSALDDEATDLHSVNLEEPEKAPKAASFKSKGELALLVFTIALLVVLLYLIGRLFI